MDYNYDDLKVLIESNGGVVSAADLQHAGIERIGLYALLANEILKKESHGNYVLAENEPDEYKIIQNRSEKLIYSHGTALFLNGMSDRVPHTLDITVPQGDNISRIKKAYQNTRFHYCKKELWNLGIMN
ncbi:MAG: type IV toxin-antitoxin system AbiEi family antitoxin domain-containing protein, partial [Lachnospiraceae bacterium]|nr:type IV toxin-antitoxin system AbiEi family antitoxin domain-containing protein [Lachnospiraceae bacterium]